MNRLAPSVFATHPVYLLFRQEGAGRIDIEHIFDAFAGQPPKASSIDAKLKGLRDRGFADPVKMIASSPAILGYAFENIDAKLKGLRDRGFADPVKMIVTLPAILGLAFENIDAKLKGLRDRGFADPVKMIASSPAILGYSMLRIHFVSEIVDAFAPGSVSLFGFLINKEPSALAAASVGARDEREFRKQWRVSRRWRVVENIVLLRNSKRGAIVKAYFDYRPFKAETVREAA